jgi:hypothetical protein
MRTLESHHDVSNLDTVLTLPWQTSVMAVASACRDAALVFVNDSRYWGKAELAMWLIGPYAQLLRHTSRLAARTSASKANEADRLAEIDARFVERVLENARREVLSTLETSVEDGASFAFTMICSEYVVRCVDTSGTTGWVPTGNPRRLADRVLSLFGADYLTRPSAADAELSVCEICGLVDLDPVARTRGICQRHRSAIVLRRGVSGSTKP